MWPENNLHVHSLLQFFNLCVEEALQRGSIPHNPRCLSSMEVQDWVGFLNPITTSSKSQINIKYKPFRDDSNLDVLVLPYRKHEYYRRGFKCVFCKLLEKFMHLGSFQVGNYLIFVQPLPLKVCEDVSMNAWHLKEVVYNVYYPLISFVCSDKAFSVFQSIPYERNVHNVMRILRDMVGFAQELQERGIMMRGDVYIHKGKIFLGNVRDLYIRKGYQRWRTFLYPLVRGKEYLAMPDTHFQGIFEEEKRKESEDEEKEGEEVPRSDVIRISEDEVVTIRDYKYHMFYTFNFYVMFLSYVSRYGVLPYIPESFWKCAFNRRDWDKMAFLMPLDMGTILRSVRLRRTLVFPEDIWD